MLAYQFAVLISLVSLVAHQHGVVGQQSAAKLDSVEIAVAEKDQLSIKYSPVEYPAGLSKPLECDGSQKVSIKFSVRDQTGDISVQQAAIYLVNVQTNEEIIYLADQDRTSKVYSKDINLAYKGRDFGYQSGDYLIRLVVGDSSLQKSINWPLGQINIQFIQDPLVETSWLERYLIKPEIVHQFRQAEKRPPAVVSQTFTLLCLSPALVLFYCWAKIGLNVGKLSFSFSALLFHGSLLLIFALYTLFFIRLNMFTTLKCLSGVLATAFISGHYLLKNLASK